MVLSQFTILLKTVATVNIESPLRSSCFTPWWTATAHLEAWIPSTSARWNSWCLLWCHTVPVFSSPPQKTVVVFREREQFLKIRPANHSYVLGRLFIWLNFFPPVLSIKTQVIHQKFRGNYSAGFLNYIYINVLHRSGSFQTFLNWSLN